MVTVSRDKTSAKTPKAAKGMPKAEPKRRGRKRKSESGATGDQIFSGTHVGDAVIAVPPALVVDGDSDPLFQPQNEPVVPSEGPAQPPVENPASTWPTRNTFAGRNNTGSVWEERRKAFYSSIPSARWKDGEERKFWRLCCEFPLEGAVAKFLEGAQGDSNQSPPAAKSHGKAPKSKAVKAKSKVVPKEPGRGRGRGRGRCARGKAACRQ